MEESIAQEVDPMGDRSRFAEAGADGGQEGVDEATSEESSAFWNRLQSELDVEIPIYVKNIMRLCHLDQPLNFRCIQDETLAELERFARKRMIYQLMGVPANLQDYYGPFHRMPSKFEFAVGDRLLVKRLVALAKSKSDDFWKRSARSSRRSASATSAPPAPSRARGCRAKVVGGGRQEPVDGAVRHEQQQQLQQQFEEQQQQDDGTSSELEDEEEEKQEKPLDINEERRKLADMVRCALLKEDYGEGLDSKQVAGRVKVRVTVKSSEEQGVQRDVVTGFIKCVFCPTKLMIRKQVFGSRRPRWVISNYRRHIRFHLDGKLKRPSCQDFVDQMTTCKPEFYLVNCDSKMLTDDDNQEDQLADETNQIDENDEQE